MWLEGEPIDELTDATADLDLLAVGSRGYGPLRAVLLGGVSAALMRQAGCPVAIVLRAASTRRRVVPAEQPESERMRRTSRAAQDQPMPVRQPSAPVHRRVVPPRLA